jgi:hypothetical protein
LGINWLAQASAQAREREGGEHSGQKHVRWDGCHPEQQSNPGIAQGTSLASVVSGKLFRSRCFFFGVLTGLRGECSQIWRVSVGSTIMLITAAKWPQSEALQAAPRASFQKSESQFGASLRRSVAENRSVVLATRTFYTCCTAHADVGLFGRSQQSLASP